MEHQLPPINEIVDADRAAALVTAAKNLGQLSVHRLAEESEPYTHHSFPIELARYPELSRRQSTYTGKVPPGYVYIEISGDMSPAAIKELRQQADELLSQPLPRSQAA